LAERLGNMLHPYWEELPVSHTVTLNMEELEAMRAYYDTDVGGRALSDTNPMVAYNLVRYLEAWDGGKNARVVEIPHPILPDEPFLTIEYDSDSNPKGHWDWYEVGGRWGGMLTTNEVGQGRLGGTFTISETCTADAAMLRDISNLLPVRGVTAIVDRRGWHGPTEIDSILTSLLLSDENPLIILVDIHS
jgi:hypothetical protein